jgi:ATP-dependent Clp protease ATP-binding subunit ClpA
LFSGRTGVGKTELSKVLADELTNGSLIRIDCSEYQQAHEISKIFGAPPGYVGFEDDSRGPHQGSPPSTVAAKLKAIPFSVVLFDEIEKADPAINNVLLQIMDEGHVTSGRGETISFNNAVVVLTSNIGTAEAEEACDANKLGFGEDARDFSSLTESVIQDAIKKRFKPEFRNRLTETIIFNSLTKEVCRGIVDVLLNKTKEHLEKAQHISFLWDDTVRSFVLDQGFSEEYGAREIMRVIQKQVELPLARYILNKKYTNKEDQLPSGTTIYISVEDNEIKFNEVLPNGKEASIRPEPVFSAAPRKAAVP